MEASQATQLRLDTKLTQLQNAVGKTKTVIDSSKREAIERQYAAVKSISTDVNQMRFAVEAKKIEDKEEVAEIETWNAELDARLAEADNEIERLRKWLDNHKREQEMIVREDQFAFEAKLHESRMKYETELKIVKADSGYVGESQKTTNVPVKGMMAKLPKLVISKFSGNYQDWQRFWSQFIETIDKTDIAPITKFTYLCELLDSKIKHVVDSLPFTTEGYNRAKSILQERYGKESEIVKSYIKDIMELPHISSANPKKISEFSERLNHCVQALQTMGKIAQVDGNAAMTLDKLPAIRGDLARTDPNWEKWNYAQLSEAIRLWTRRNPVDPNRSERERELPVKVFHARRNDFKSRDCIYCGDDSHKTTECTKITNVQERKQILLKKRLCFNCAIGSHRAADCSSKTSCKHCQKRHHSSICDTSREVLGLSTEQSGEGVFPVIVIKVNGVKCRALIDSGAGSSYVSAKLVNILKAKPEETQIKQVDMLMSTKRIRMESYQLTAESVDDNHKMNAKFIKVNKAELLSIENPNYQGLIRNHAHLKGVKITDNDKKKQLPIHVVFGNGEYARIKTETKPRVGNDGEPVAELTKMGWFIMSPGAEFDRKTMLLTQTSQSDYEGLCRMDVLGLEDTPEFDQVTVHAEFKEQLRRAEEGWYETGLPWRANHPELPNNKQGSLQRLENLTRRLQRKGQTSAYSEIIQDQFEAKIIENAPTEVIGREFYIPHKAVVRETATTTKLRVVYDASARAYPQAPSLNECLNPGPPLQNRLWDVLLRQRAYPVVVTGDIRQAFLQVRIRETERDALRFHWRSSEDKEIETFRFTRALFGLAPSPFLLNGVLAAHLDAWEGRRPDVVAELRKCLYVDDLLTGGQTVTQARQIKEVAREILSDATFQLHKWNSNVNELEEDDNTVQSSEEQTFAKQQLNVKPDESKMLGLKWDKKQDTLAVIIPSEEAEPTKRGILRRLARIYDPLGLVAPLTLSGKLIYREVCETKKSWDTELSHDLLRRWRKWEQQLPREFQVPRPIAQHREAIEEVELHGFGDASAQGVGAVVYAVVRQHSGNTQQLLAAKSRLAKKGLTIPRLELVAAHMTTNLLVNVRNALDNIPTPRSYAWSDSTVALHWIKGNGQYKQFVANRVAKIQLQKKIQWRYVSTEQNPADLASRGGPIHSSALWHHGPEWLHDKCAWPNNPVIESSPASKAEARIIKEVLSIAKVQPKIDELDQLLERVSLRSALRVGVWVKRFTHNCRNRSKKFGPLSSEEIKEERDWWIHRIQEREKEEPNYPRISAELNLQPNAQGLTVCHGRIQGEHPIYLPNNAKFTERLIEQAHQETLHGGVGLTMSAVRERYWVPRLRSLAKSVRSKCHGCKRFRATAVITPAPGKLPKNRTTVAGAFEIIGTDFAGPIRYKKVQKKEGKAYLAIFACSLSRAVHLELLPNMETDTFIPCLKRFIARRGRPRVIYSDNGGTFIKAEKWIRQLRKDERLQGLLEQYDISWKFNLSRAPWWGGQFERLIGVVKSAMYKTIGGTKLTWLELSEVLLDVETQINRRPLNYVEDDIELPTLTPATFLFQRTIQLPEEETWRIKEKDLRKRAKYLRTCKDSLWNRWRREYLTALRERHNLTHKASKFQPKNGDVVIVKADNKNRGNWPLAIVCKTYPGQGGIIRAVQLKTANGTIERPVQHLYPPELQCDSNKASEEPRLNPDVPDFRPRPRRDAAEAAKLRMGQVAEVERSEL